MRQKLLRSSKVYLQYITADHKVRSYSGFTIIELIISIIIVGILATVISINFPHVATNINLNAQAESLANDIRYAQNFAMTKGEHCQFEVFTQTNNYRINNSTIHLDKKISFGAITNNLIIFNSNGVPYINNTATINLTTTNGNTATITIYPETGSVTIS